MSVISITVFRNWQAATLAALLGCTSPAIALAETPMTGKVMMENMEPKEFVAFVTGMVEAMAYARFRKDTLAAGRRVEDGMNCIRRWFFSDPKRILAIGNAFERYHQYTAWVVLGVLLKQECGE